MSDTVFVDGLFFKFVGPYGDRPDKTPKFVLSRASINCAKLHKFMKASHSDGWVNFDILLAKDGKKVYAKLDTYKKDKDGGDWESETTGGMTQEQKQEYGSATGQDDDRDWSNGNPDDIPF